MSLDELLQKAEELEHICFPCTPIHKAGVSPRLRRTLRRAGLRCAEELQLLSDEELRQKARLNPRELAEVRVAVISKFYGE